MLLFVSVKKLFTFFRSPTLKWKLRKFLPSLFFIPHMWADEYALFDKITRKKKVILEFGSGGSTVHFIKRHKKIYSVESNPDFYGYMKSISLVKKALGKSLFLKFIDLGNTDLWGRPVSLERKENWHNYYTEVWKAILENESKVDVVFLDGRFRISCCLYSILQVLNNNWKDTIFMIHDFWNRQEYKVLLKFLNEIESRSRLAAFTARTDIDVDELKSVLQKHSSVFQ